MRLAKLSTIDFRGWGMRGSQSALLLMIFACRLGIASECLPGLTAIYEASRTGQPVILGAGPVGSNLAIHLAELGAKPVVVEMRPDPRQVDAVSDRSFNFTLSTRGRAAFTPDVRNTVDAASAKLVGRQVHLPDGRTMNQDYGRAESGYDHSTYAVSRAVLAKTLVEAAEDRGAQFVFGTELSSANLNEGTGTFLTRNGPSHGIHSNVPIPLVIGADGANSVMRTAIASAAQSHTNLKTLEDASYRTFVLPPRADGTPVFEAGRLHVWPRGELAITAIPDKNGSTSIILVVPLKGEGSFESLHSVDDYRHLLEKNFPEFLELEPNLPQILMSKPTGLAKLPTAEKWNYGNRYLIMGDAAHGMPYWAGQGTNTGLEGTGIFRGLVESEGNIQNAIEAFPLRRKHEAQKVQQLSVNYRQVLTSGVGEKKHLFKMSLERELVRRYPDRFRKASEFTTFSTIPLSTAFQHVDTQTRIMQAIVDTGAESFDQVDWNFVDRLVTEIKPMDTSYPPVRMR